MGGLSTTWSWKFEYGRSGFYIQPLMRCYLYKHINQINTVMLWWFNLITYLFWTLCAFCENIFWFSTSNHHCGSTPHQCLLNVMICIVIRWTSCFFGSVNIVLSSRIAESCKRRNAFPNQRVASTLPVKDFDLVPSPSQHVVSELLVKDFVFAFSGPTP